MKTKLRKFLLLLSMLFCVTGLYSQNFTIKNVSMVTDDFSASKEKRKDNYGNTCALIKVQIPSDETFTFDESVRTVQKVAGEYRVYVSPGTDRLIIRKNRKIVEIITFSDYNVEIKSTATYLVQLNQRKKLVQVFNVSPANAMLRVNGMEVDIDADGIASFECEDGNLYEYEITCEGYDKMEGSFMVTPEENSLEPIDILLDRQLTLVTLLCTAKKFDVVLESGETFTTRNNTLVNFPKGRYRVQVMAEGYETLNGEVVVDDNTKELMFSLSKQKSNVTKKLRKRIVLYGGGGYCFTFDNRTNMEKETVEGYPFRLGLEYEHFLARHFTFRIGGEFMGYGGDNMKCDDETPMVVDLPFSFNINIPLGKFNRHHFSIGVGPMLGLGWYKEEESSDEDSTGFFYGFRADARFTLNHFVIGVNVDYHNCKTFLDDDYIAPMAFIGYKF